jgi:hypothetical protein
MAAFYNVTIEKLKRKYYTVAVFFKSQPDQVLKRKITMESEFRWKWNNYLATEMHHLTDKFCCLPLRDGQCVSCIFTCVFYKNVNTELIDCGEINASALIIHYIY